MIHAVWRQSEGQLSGILEPGIVPLHLQLDVVHRLVGQAGVLEEQVEFGNVVHQQASTIMSFVKTCFKFY